jgi:cysteinyl-tRNA synthetase
MSKSEGNFFTVRDILKEYSGETIRFFLLAGHYRSPIDFSRALMEQSKSALDRMYNAKNTLEHLISKGFDELADKERESLDGLSEYRARFIRAMDDDLNTADAIAAIFELITEVNGVVKDGASKEYAREALAMLAELTGVLGLLERSEAEEPEEEADAELKSLIAERQKAREEKDWARADEIRDELKKRGITLKDTPQGLQIIREG